MQSHTHTPEPAKAGGQVHDINQPILIDLTAQTNCTRDG